MIGWQIPGEIAQNFHCFNNWKDFVGVELNILSKMKPKYFHISFGCNIGPFNRLRSKEGGLKFLVDLEKWKTSDSTCLTISLKREKKW